MILLAFRRRFEGKGRLTPFVAAIPTQLIMYPDLALLGAARSGITSHACCIQGIDDDHWQVSLTAMRHEGKVLLPAA